MRASLLAVAKSIYIISVLWLSCDHAADPILAGK